MNEKPQLERKLKRTVIIETILLADKRG